jgi:hypothetical protein
MSGLEIILPLIFAGVSAAAGAGDLASRLKSDKTASSVRNRIVAHQLKLEPKTAR